MLKIKDNVDLKELEKFGFKRIQYINEISEDDWKKISLIQDEDGNVRTKTKEDKFPYDEVNWAEWTKGYFSIIEFDNTEEMKEREIIESDIDGDTLYDLIKADLVEKVEG